MTAIFISHSSADNAAAAEMKAWLEAQGHSSLFLDFDPEAGIKGGSGWEQTLYQHLRQCQAVIALLTPNWLASKWCFAELVQARERGKAIFPLKVQPCDASGVFSDIQQIDLTAQPEDGYRRLKIGLLERGLNPMDVFDWDPRRLPYPGLMAFQEADAAIFFGRGEDILKTLETLDGLRCQGRDAARFLLLLGASGSGKSSLVRAGVIPRLKKKQSEWLPVPPFRPQVEPLDELAMALATAFEAQGRPRDWSTIRTELHLAAAKDPADGQTLLKLARDLAIAARQPETTVLLTIDQAEELFGYSPPEVTTRFLRLLRAALEVADQRLMVVATLRSDFLGDCQNHPVLQDGEYPHHFRYRDVLVNPMPLRSFPEVILGPARLAGLRLDDGLVEAMVNDTGTRDALPLLAFTLRRLYERFGGDGRLTVHEYESLGRLEGAVREEAQRVIAEANPVPEELEALHAAFVPTMVRINAEGGYARRRALFAMMTQQAVPLLRRFVDARLLVTDSDPKGRETVEVAHEALLRTWPQLGGWLAEDQDKLRLLESIQRSAEEWDQGGRREDLLIHRNGRLKDAEALLANPRFTIPEISTERAYLDACAAAQQAREAAEKEEQERRIRDAERIAEEQKKAAEAQKNIARRTKIGLALVALVAALAVWQYFEAARETKVATSRQLAAQALVGLDVHAPRNLLLALESILITQQIGASSATTSRQLLSDVLNATGGIPLKHAAPVVAVAYSPDDRWLAAASAGNVLLWDMKAQSATAIPLRGHEKVVNALAFSPDGRTLATVGDDAGVRVWDMAAVDRAPSVRFLAAHNGHLVDVAFSRNGRWLATASKDGVAQLWDLAAADPATATSIMRHEKGVNTLAFSPDNHWLATGSSDGTVRLWDLLGPNALTDPIPLQVTPDVRKVAFSPDSQWLVAGSTENYAVALMRVIAPDKPLFLKVNQWVGALAFSPDGRWLATPSQYDARLWDLNKPDPSIEPLILPGHKYYIAGLAFSPDGLWFATGSADHTVQLWNVANRFTAPAVLRGHEGPITGLAFSHDSRHLGTASVDQTVRLWNISSPVAEPLALRTGDRSKGMHMWDMRAPNLPAVPRILGDGLDPGAGSVFSSDGQWLAIIPSGELVDFVHLWNLSTPSPTHYIVRHKGGIWASPVFSPDGRWLATGGVGDPTVRLWDLKARDPTNKPQVLRGHRGAVRSLAFSADGHRLVTGANDGLAFVWTLNGADPSSNPRSLAGGGGTSIVHTVAISRDGRYVVTGSWEPDYAARIWDLFAPVTSSSPTVLNFKARLDEVAFSADGRWVAAGSWDFTTQLLDLKKPSAKPFVLLGHTARVLSVAFSPDSRWLATGNEDQTARLWNLAAADPSTESIVLKTPYRIGNVSFSADGRWLALNSTSYSSNPFSPDGHWFASSSADTRLFHLSLEELILLACRTAGRNLTPKEWEISFRDQPHRATCPGLEGVKNAGEKLIASVKRVE